MSGAEVEVRDAGARGRNAVVYALPFLSPSPGGPDVRVRDCSLCLVDIGSYERRATGALSALDAIADGRIEGARTAWHCCLEFFSVTTRLPEEYRLEPETVLRLLREEILPRFAVFELPEAAYRDFLTVAVGEGAAGGRIYDAHIAEIARRSGAGIVVADNRRHFTSLMRHGVRVLDSAELADELEGC